MRQLILLYWGCVFLMYLSQFYYPTSMQLEGPQTGRCHFMLRKADVYMFPYRYSLSVGTKSMSSTRSRRS